MDTPAPTAERNLEASFSSPTLPPTPIIRRKCRSYFPECLLGSVVANVDERTPAPTVGRKRLHPDTLAPDSAAASLFSPSPPPTPIVRRKCRSFFAECLSGSVVANVDERTPAPTVGRKRLHPDTLASDSEAASFFSPSPPPTPIVRRKCRCHTALNIQNFD